MITPSTRMLLRDPNPSVREAVVLELVFAPDPELLPDLLGLLADPHADVRRTTIQALGALNSDQALEGLCYALLDPVPEVMEAAQGALVKLGSVAQAALEGWLEHPEWPQRAAALRVLALMQPDIERLSALILDPIWEVRGEAYLALAHTQEADALSSLQKSLQVEQHPQAREALLTALGDIQQPAAFKLLLEFFLDPLSEESPDVVATALQNYGQSLHAPLLNAGIWSVRPEIKMLSAVLLAQSACPDLPKQLAPLLLDSQPKVRQTVAYAIYESAPNQAIWEFVAGLYHPDDHVFEAAMLELLAYPGVGAGERILEALELEQSPLRASQLIRSLGELKYESASHVLVELLESASQAAVIEALIWSLGRLSAWRAWHSLQRLLGHKEPAIRRLAIEALILIDPETPCWQKLEHFKELGPEAQRSFLAELSGYPDSWSFFNFELFNNPEAATRANLLSSLKAFSPELVQDALVRYLASWPRPDAETLEPLLDLMEQVSLSEALARSVLPWIEERDAGLRTRIARLLRPWAQQLKHELIAASSHEIWFVRQAALQALAGQQDEDIIQILTQSLDDRDRDVRVTAISLLAQLDSLEMGSSLIEALENGYREIRAAAATALGKQLSQHPDRDIRESLSNALSEDEAAEVRLAAAEALGQSAEFSKSLLETLSEAFEEDDALEVQMACLTAIWRIDPESARPLIIQAFKDDDENMLELALSLYASSGWKTEPINRTLELMIQSENPALQSKALRMLLPNRPDLLGTWLKEAKESLRLACMQNMGPQEVQTHQVSLIFLLTDASPQIRQQALKTLAQVPELRPVLAAHARKEEEPSVLQVLIELMADLPVDEVLPVYQEILERPTPHLHTSIIWALAPVLALGGGSMLQSLLPNAGPALRSQIFQVLAQPSSQALPILQDLADHWDRDLVLRAIRALGQMGAEAVPILEEIWKREELAQQLAALEACTTLRLPQTLPMLLLAARSNHDNLRAHAMEALIGLGQPAYAGVQQLLQDHDPRIRFDACHILAVLEPANSLWLDLRGISSAMATRRLKHLLALQQRPEELWLRQAGHLRRDPSYHVRAQFCQTQSAEQAFRRWLLRCLQTEVLPVRQHAALALASQPDQDTPIQLISCWPKAPASFREILLSTLAQLGLSGQAMQGLEDFSAHVRISAACISGQHQLEAALYKLCELLRYDPSWEVRAACAWALGHYQRPDMLPLLAEAIHEDLHPAVQHQAILAIAKIPSMEASLQLVQLLERKDWDVFLREEALNAVAQLKVEAAVPSILLRLRSEEDLQNRKRLLDTLALIGNVEALGYLRELALYEADILSIHAQKLLEGLLAEHD